MTPRAATTGTVPDEPAAPRPDPDSEFYWNGLRDQKLLLQRCDDCKRFRFPPMPCCPFCRSRMTSVHESCGQGIVYSWIVVHRAFDQAFTAEVPYTIATIDFDEGARMAVRVDAPGELCFGQRVRATFVPHETWTELRVTPEPTRDQEM